MHFYIYCMNNGQLQIIFKFIDLGLCVENIRFCVDFIIEKRKEKLLLYI